MTRVAAATLILAVSLFAAGADPVGAAVVTVVAVTVLLVIARPALSVCPPWRGHVVALSQLVLPRSGRDSQEAGGEDCPLILTVIRR